MPALGGDDAHEAFARREVRARPAIDLARDDLAIVGAVDRRRRGNSPSPGLATTLMSRPAIRPGSVRTKSATSPPRLGRRAVVDEDAHRLGEFLHQVRLPAKAPILRAEHGAVEAVDQLVVGEGPRRRRRESRRGVRAMRLNGRQAHGDCGDHLCNTADEPFIAAATAAAKPGACSCQRPAPCPRAWSRERTAGARCWWPGADRALSRLPRRGMGAAGRRTTSRLFEKLCLEGFQSGLSWLTILRKRENFRAAFAGFDFEKVAKFGARDVKRCLADAGIVRHRGKIESVINNAKRARELVDEEGSLAAFIWRYEPDPKVAPEADRARRHPPHARRNRSRFRRSCASAAGPSSGRRRSTPSCRRWGWSTTICTVAPAATRRKRSGAPSCGQNSRTEWEPPGAAGVAAQTRVCSRRNSERCLHGAAIE